MSLLDPADRQAPDQYRLAFAADGWILCWDCVTMRYRLPCCDLCLSMPSRGWWAVGRPHRDCGGRFRSVGDSCEDIAALRQHGRLECSLCDAEIPARNAGGNE